jgi:predicted O-methyltransferase YrrM
MPNPTERSFDEVLKSVDDVAGWMSPDQARRLWDRACERKPGDTIVEIGSFQGRSTTVLASAAPEGVDIIAIDPHGGTDRGPEEYTGFEQEGQQDFEIFHRNLERAGVAHRVRHVRKYSNEALGDAPASIELLYIDGAHRYQPARDDIRSWGKRVPAGGSLLIHDSFSSIGVTLAIITQLFFSRDFRYVGRSRSLTEYRRERLTLGERGRNAARQVAQLPWFAYNLLLKALIAAGLGRFTKHIGHPSGEWPY